jgi:hypothetical protein
MTQLVYETLSSSKINYLHVGNGILSTNYYRLDTMEFLLLEFIVYLLALIFYLLVLIFDLLALIFDILALIFDLLALIFYLLVLIVCLLVFFVWEWDMEGSQKENSLDY